MNRMLGYARVSTSDETARSQWTLFRRPVVSASGQTPHPAPVRIDPSFGNLLKTCEMGTPWW